MCEILKENFADKFPKIQKDFENAVFFAIDNEFSGIIPVENLSHFDSMDQRYLKQKKAMEEYVIIQIGVTAFQFCEKTNMYWASTYSFHLIPQSIGYMDTKVSWRTSCLQFLRQHEFDFNKLVYHGVSYLSHEEEKELRNLLDSRDLLHNLNKYLNHEERQEIQKVCSEISDKIEMKKSLQRNSMDQSIDKEKENDPGCKIELQPLLALVTYCQIQERYPEVTIHQEDYGMRLDLNSSPENCATNYSVNVDMFKERVIHSLKGFTQVFDLLIAMKKPIVGHNVFVDLLMMFKQFHRPLPESLQAFKVEIHNLFPIMYDSKFICQQLMRCHRAHFRKDVWPSSSLEGVYKYFQDGFKGFGKGIPCPAILPSPDVANTRNFHNAGWDSYCAGHIFLRMVHLSAILSKNMVYKGEVPTTEEYLNYAEQFSNKINIIVGKVSYIVLDGNDPPSFKPNHLFVCSRTKAELDIAQVEKACCNYGTIQVKQLSKHTALIATRAKLAHRDILRNLKNHPDLKIECYSLVRHHPVVRFAFWSTIALVASANVLLVVQHILPLVKK